MEAGPLTAGQVCNHPASALELAQHETRLRAAASPAMPARRVQHWRLQPAHAPSFARTRCGRRRLRSRARPPAWLLPLCSPRAAGGLPDLLHHRHCPMGLGRGAQLPAAARQVRGCWGRRAAGLAAARPLVGWAAGGVAARARAPACQRPALSADCPAARRVLVTRAGRLPVRTRTPTARTRARTRKASRCSRWAAEGAPLTWRPARAVLAVGMTESQTMHGRRLASTAASRWTARRCCSAARRCALRWRCACRQPWELGAGCMLFQQRCTACWRTGWWPYSRYLTSTAAVLYGTAVWYHHRLVLCRRPHLAHRARHQGACVCGRWRPQRGMGEGAGGWASVLAARRGRRGAGLCTHLASLLACA